MAIQPYLVFDGNCEDVLAFYEKVFQTGPAKKMRFGDTPPNPDYPLPENAKKRIMHANLEIEGTVLLFSDTFPGTPYQSGGAISLAVVSADEEKLRSYFNGLAENGEVHMPLQKTFWSKAYGKVRDQFGIEWQVSHEEKA